MPGYIGGSIEEGRNPCSTTALATGGRRSGAAASDNRRPGLIFEPLPARYQYYQQYYETSSIRAPDCVDGRAK
jgi:hypothetical protein